MHEPSQLSAIIACALPRSPFIQPTTTTGAGIPKTPTSYYFGFMPPLERLRMQGGPLLEEKGTR